MFLRIVEKLCLFVWRAKLIYIDYFDNRYYELRSKDFFGRHKRYVQFYKKTKDASFVPPICEVWLRGGLSNEDLINSEDVLRSISYISPHAPNFTGTDYRYLPITHPLNKHTCQVAQASDMVYFNSNNDVYIEWDGNVK